MPVRVIPWSGDGPPTEAEIVGRMRAEGLSPSGWSNGPGDRYGVHSHTYHKVLYCVSGGIRFTLPGGAARWAGQPGGLRSHQSGRSEGSEGFRRFPKVFL